MSASLLIRLTLRSFYWHPGLPKQLTEIKGNQSKYHVVQHFKRCIKPNSNLNLTRVEVSLISYKDSILDFLVRSLYETKEIIYDPWMITRNHIWYPSTITKNHTSIFWKSLTSYVFCFYSVGHHLYDTQASHCDPPKDLNVKHQLQVGHKQIT